MNWEGTSPCIIRTSNTRSRGSKSTKSKTDIRTRILQSTPNSKWRDTSNPFLAVNILHNTHRRLDLPIAGMLSTRLLPCHKIAHRRSKKPRKHTRQSPHNQLFHNTQSLLTPRHSPFNTSLT